MSPEELREAMATADAGGADVSEEFKSITSELIEKYRPVFHRLAQ